jgi:hypothetical protein
VGGDEGERAGRKTTRTEIDERRGREMEGMEMDGERREMVGTSRKVQ